MRPMDVVAAQMEGGKRRKRRSSTCWYNQYKRKIETSKRKNMSIMKHKNFKLPKQQHTWDKIWIGDNMKVHPKKSDTRFMLLNCNGLDIKQDDNYLRSQLQCMLETEAHFIGLTEININARNPMTSNKIQEITKEILPEGITTINNSQSIGDTEYQPGGVAQIFYGRICQRHSTVSRDPGGRWIRQKFIGETRNLFVYTLYRVNNSTAKGGSITAWEQQKNYLRSHNCDTNPRKQVIIDIIKDVKKNIDQREAILLQGDFNENLSSPEKTKVKLESIGLVNVMASRIQELPRTYVGGIEAIDHIWASPVVSENISLAGFAPFYYKLYSDHRAIIFDINLKNILDEDIIHIPTFATRILKTSNPERVQKYNEVLKDQWEYHKVQEKFTSLTSQFQKQGNTEANVIKLNNLDKMITSMMIHAERKCSRIFRKPIIPWSPTIHTAIKNIQHALFKKREASRIGKNSYSKSTENYKKACEHYTNMKNEYKEIRKKATTLRNEFLTRRIELLQNRCEFRNKCTVKILSILKHREKQRREANRINCVLKGKFRLGVNSILIPEASEYNTEVNIYDISTMWTRIQKNYGKDIRRWRRVTDRTLVEKLLIEWQNMHFLQANETPFTSPEWEKKLKTNTVQESITNGTFQVTNFPPECQEVFDQMARTTKCTNEINLQTTFKEFQSFICNSKESTSSSPSGRHYGHYKALLERNQKILEIIHGIFSLAIQHKIILHRWSLSVTTLIEKNPGVPKIHRFRAIHVIESEMQFITKVAFARRMMWNAEDKGLITDEQYGGRKRRQALTIIINKLMYYNITHQSLTPAAFMDDDARACYDRIVPYMVMTEARKWGISRDTADYATKILQNQHFRLRTNHGSTTAKYQYTNKNRINGAGQGWAWSGPLWTCSSDTISKALQVNSVGMQYTDPTRQIQISKIGDFFVDDTSTAVTEETIPKHSTILKELGNTEQKHAFYLFTLGHKIAFDKCKYYLAEFIRDGIRYRHKSIQEHPGELHLREGFNQQPTKIERCEPWVEHKTLGHYLSIDGTQTNHYKTIHQKMQNWRNKIQCSSLSNTERIAAYNGWLVPALKYKLLSSTFTETECDHLSQIISGTLFNGFGIQRNCSKVVLYSSHMIGGLNIQHLYQMQGSIKLKMFLWHCRRNDSTGKLLKISMNFTQLEIGIEQPFLESTYSNYNHIITRTWITSIWEYLTKCRTKLYCTKPAMYVKPRKNDRYIMDVIFEANIPPNQTQEINQVRLYLNVLTLSDIVALNSNTTILQEMYKATKQRKSKWKWPNITEIKTKWIKTWANVLRTIIKPYLEQRPLGSWIGETHQKCNALITPDRKILKIQDQLFEFDARTQMYIQKEYQQEPNNFTKIMADFNHYSNKLLSIIPMPTKLSQHHQPSPNYYDIISTLPYATRRNLGTTFITPSICNKIEHTIQKGYCLAVSDGSCKHGIGSHSWCITDAKEERKIICSQAPVDGPRSEMNAYRTEAFGTLAILQVLQIIHQKTGKWTNKVCIMLDCKAILMKIKLPLLHSVRCMIDDDIDILLEIQHIIKELDDMIEFKHIKGHQNDDIPYDQLPYPARLNCDMDHLAKLFIQKPPPRLRPNQKYPILQAQKYYFQQNQTVLQAHIQNRLNDRWIEAKWKKYIVKNIMIPSEYINDINFGPIHSYMKTNRITVGQIAKLIHGQINTMEQCKTWSTSLTDKCPLCQLCVEDTRHILQCPHHIIKKIRDEELSKLRQRLIQLRTSPPLQEFLMTAIINFIGEKPVPQPKLSMDQTDLLLHQAYLSQRKLGWFNLLRGFLSIRIQRVQEHFISHNKGRYGNISAWSNGVVKALLQMYRRIWNSRCEIVALENNETLTKRRRELELRRHNEYKKKEYCLLPSDHYLVTKNSSFFITAPFKNVLMWAQQMDVAIARADRKVSDGTADIRKFGINTYTKKIKQDIRAIKPSQLYWNLRKKTASRNIHTIVHQIQSTSKTNIVPQQPTQKSLMNHFKKTKTQPQQHKQNKQKNLITTYLGNRKIKGNNGKICNTTRSARQTFKKYYPGGCRMTARCANDNCST